MTIKDSNDKKHSHIQNQMNMSALQYKNKVLENQLQQMNETKIKKEKNFPQAALTVSHSHILTVSQSQPALERVNSLNFLQKQSVSTRASKNKSAQQKQIVESGPLMESIKKLGLGNGKMV